MYLGHRVVRVSLLSTIKAVLLQGTASTTMEGRLSPRADRETAVTDGSWRTAGLVHASRMLPLRLGLVEMARWRRLEDGEVR
ncbi:hypothetical protein BKA81DRAFT_353570 [Phyllosticta paracitricarpa]